MKRHHRQGSKKNGLLRPPLGYLCRRALTLRAEVEEKHGIVVPRRVNMGRYGGDK